MSHGFLMILPLVCSFITKRDGFGAKGCVFFFGHIVPGSGVISVIMD